MAGVREKTGVTGGERAGVGGGWVIFASVMMIMGGVFAIFEGLAALLKHGDFYRNVSNYPFDAHVATWGWIVLICGVIVMLAGISVMTGALWARIVGITIASLSALSNFFFIPFYPFWALTVITIDVFVIWALAAHGKALVEE